MKKILFSLIIASAIVSCSDDIDSPNNGSDPQQTVDASKSKSLNSKSTITYIAAENMATEFDIYVIDVIGDHDEPLIEVYYNSVTDIYAVSHEPEAPEDPEGIVVCRGDLGHCNKVSTLLLLHGIGWGDCTFSTRNVFNDIWETTADCP